MHDDALTMKFPWLSKICTSPLAMPKRRILLSGDQATWASWFPFSSFPQIRFPTKRKGIYPTVHVCSYFPQYGNKAILVKWVCDFMVYGHEASSYFHTVIACFACRLIFTKAAAVAAAYLIPHSFTDLFTFTFIASVSHNIMIAPLSTVTGLPYSTLSNISITSVICWSCGDTARGTSLQPAALQKKVERVWICFHVIFHISFSSSNLFISSF